MSPTETPASTPSARGRWLRVGLIAAALAAVAPDERDAAEHLIAFAGWVDGFGAWAVSYTHLTLPTKA